MGCSPRCFHWPLSRAGRCRAGHTSRSARPLCGGYTHTCQTPALQRNVSLAVAAHSSLTKPYQNTYNSPLPIFLNTGWVHIHPQICRRGNKLLYTFTLLFTGGYAAIHPKNHLQNGHTYHITRLQADFSFISRKAMFSMAMTQTRPFSQKRVHSKWGWIQRIRTWFRSSQRPAVNCG